MFDIKFSIGYNHDLRLLKLLEGLKDYVESFYFPVPNRLMGSGRAIQQEDNYEENIKEIIKTCKRANIKSLLLLNATSEREFDQKHIEKIVNYVKSLDVDGVVVVNPVYIPELRKLNVEIQSSVNCYTKTVEQAMDLKEMGVNVLTIDRDINRDLDLIKKIKEKTGLKIKMLVNEGCLRNCVFRKTHFNLISNNIDTVEFDKRSCITLLRKHPEKFFQIPFVRPEDLSKYEFVDYFKIATRTMDTIKIGLILEAYINERFEGDLLFLLSGKGIFDYFSEVDNRVLTENDFFNKITSKDSDIFAKEMLEKASLVNK